jgi:hypothetical protein
MRLFLKCLLIGGGLTGGAIGALFLFAVLCGVFGAHPV